MADPAEILLVDADVLIDFRDADIEALRLVSDHIGPLKVLTIVREQVRGLTARRCRELHIEVVEPETDDILAAARWVPSLGIVDAVCLASARSRAWACVTNDRAFGKACRREGVVVHRGLRLLIDLTQRGRLSTKAALRIAQRMHDMNPTHIHDRLLKAFRKGLPAG